MIYIGKFFKGLWSAINFSRKLILNLVFFGILILIVLSIPQQEAQVHVPDGAVLNLNLNGSLVEELTYIDPVDAAFGEFFSSNDQPKEILIDDVVNVINSAAKDDRISILLLDLKSLHGAHLNKLNAITEAIVEFKATGKKVIAHGAYYSQSQYLLASYADEISLHPYGGVEIRGFANYPLYFKDALDKLKVTQHVFRVGTYKSAVEPFIRNDMSPAAKEANQLWLNELWSQYKTDIASAREFEVSNFDEKADQYLEKMKAVNGDYAQYALQNNWVDSLQTDQQLQAKLIEQVGTNSSGKTFKNITFNKYLKALNSQTNFALPQQDKVAVIVARGNIVDGKQKAGRIGGDSTAALLKKARLNPDVKAVVLRIDSGGGSMFASEVIRNEVLAVKEAGKPIIASMGSVAASGGYWIAMSADEIWAAPSTITGSIGVFGTILTFENSLNSIGVYSDGVATTELNNISLSRGISDKLSQVFQLGVENAYDKFISLVAAERGLDKEAVDQVAQGRVWTATQAKEFGLIDKLGNKQDAIAAAATLAQLQEFDVITIEQTLSEKDQFLKELLGSAMVSTLLEANSDSEHILEKLSVLFGGLGAQVVEQLNIVNEFNDPNHIYTRCLTCEVAY
ncbi:signal peptide peptidase SppA [Pseudoalteromonas phenolica]|uniref:signal peptide peptidase SppA n=1 Tax=Pseudoalteromonas phenolica TaxID=161398 RepID=UPI003850E401